MNKVCCSRILILILNFLIFSKLCHAAPSSTDHGVPGRSAAPVQSAGFSIYLTPGNEPEDVLVRDLNAAKRDIVLETGTLQSLRVITSLESALARGVKIEIFLPEYDNQAYYFDRAQERKRNLATPNLNVRVLDSSVGLRGTVCMVDEATVLVGSFELRYKDSSSVATNLIRVENSPKIAQIYLDQCRQLQDHSHLAPLCRKYALLSSDEQKQLIHDYLNMVSGSTTSDVPFNNGTPLPPFAPPLDQFSKLPWPSGVDPAVLNRQGIGMTWVVDDQGAAKDVSISASSGNPEIDNLALGLVRQHHFVRFFENGKPVPLTKLRLFRFEELFIMPNRP